MNPEEYDKYWAEVLYKEVQGTILVESMSWKDVRKLNKHRLEEMDSSQRKRLI